ncbi:MAG: hypothetical protein AAF594_10360 [Bacteroidota bacterium]
MAFRHDPYLPEHWNAWLRSYRPGYEGRLGAGDFCGVVELRFEDGSEARFHWAFCALDEEGEELAVFTEHCLYHVFSSRALEWSGPQATL